MSYAGFIHTGGWFNWSYTGPLGATLTLPSRGGFFLNSFLTLYVTIAGTRFWIIIAFLAHQERASRTKHDGMHIQQQAILRNSGTPTSAALSFFKVAFRWRKIAKKPIWRSLPLLLLAVLSLGTFRAASLLTSEVTKAAGNETLLHSPNCTYWGPASSSATSQGGVRTKLANDAFTAASYSKACYEANSLATAECGLYAARNIPWKQVTNATCPWSPELCLSSPSAVYGMDTDYVDSHEVLGLNAHKNDRLKYRRVSTCAPIDATKFMNSSIDKNGNINQDYSLGNVTYLYTGNVTYTYNNHTISDRVGYQVSSYSSEIETQWIPEITNGMDADISIIFLTANSLLYDLPNNDPIFAATTKTTRTQGDKVTPYYVPDKLVSVLGCVDQHQWCSVTELGEPKCSGLESLNKLSADVAIFGNNSQKLATANRIYQSIWHSNMWYVVDFRGVAAIQASETVFEIFQHSLPDDQWITEVSGWFSTSLAKVQQALVEIAVGSGLTNSTDGGQFIVTYPTSDADQALCYAQVVRSSGQYLNFSVLGLAIIVSFSTFIIWLSFVIDTATGWVQRWLKKGEDRRLQWVLEDKLQLQRMAYVAAKQGNWEGHADSVPVTTEAVLVDMSLYLPANEKALAEAQLAEVTSE
jgi:hypothetical protein